MDLFPSRASFATSASRPKSACTTSGSIEARLPAARRDTSSAIRRSSVPRTGRRWLPRSTDGRIDVIATDHAPHPAFARRPVLTSRRQPACRSSSMRCRSLFDLVARGELSVELLVERACHAPADLFGVKERGYVREGWFADLVIVDPAKPRSVTRDAVLAKCGWSPFEGHEFSVPRSIRPSSTAPLHGAAAVSPARLPAAGWNSAAPGRRGPKLFTFRSIPLC